MGKKHSFYEVQSGGCALYMGMLETTKFQAQNLGCALYTGASYTWVITVFNMSSCFFLMFGCCSVD